VKCFSVVPYSGVLAEKTVTVTSVTVRYD
jgi:hypothetical protein